MRTQQQLKERLTSYVGAVYTYTPEGYIAWQYSTGENVEILFIEVNEGRKGIGRKLIKSMCEVIEPYHSVFVVRLASNEIAGNFYRSLGFTETLVKGLYRGDDAVIGVVPFKQLCQNLSTN